MIIRVITSWGEYLAQGHGGGTRCDNKGTAVAIGVIIRVTTSWGKYLARVSGPSTLLLQTGQYSPVLDTALIVLGTPVQQPSAVIIKSLYGGHSRSMCHRDIQ